MSRIAKKYPSMSDADVKGIIPCRNTVKNEVTNTAVKIKEIITCDFRNAIQFSNGFAVTTDIWCDDQKKYSYICFTAHLNLIGESGINKKRYVFGLSCIEELQKTQQVCFNKIKDVFEDYKLSMDVVKEYVTFVTDRGSNLKAALKDYDRINCYAHLINNIVNEMCGVDTVKTVIFNASKLVKYFKHSGLNSKLSLTLKSYSETRFNTVYYTLWSIYEMYSEIILLLNEKEKTDPRIPLIQKITCINKLVLKEICDFLNSFVKLSVEIEGEKYLTLHKVWPTFDSIKKHIAYQFNDTFLINQMKNAGKNYLEKRIIDFNPKLEHELALFLHPMTKDLKKLDIEKKMLYIHM